MIADYKGTPYRDDTVGEIRHIIPGKIYMAYYDLGGEGVAYHDTLPYNQGNGGLNPLNGEYKNEFRHEEHPENSVDRFAAYLDPA